MLSVAAGVGQPRLHIWHVSRALLIGQQPEQAARVLLSGCCIAVLRAKGDDTSRPRAGEACVSAIPPPSQRALGLANTGSPVARDSDRSRWPDHLADRNRVDRGPRGRRLASGLPERPGRPISDLLRSQVANCKRGTLQRRLGGTRIHHSNITVAGEKISGTQAACHSQAINQRPRMGRARLLLA